MRRQRNLVVDQAIERCLDVDLGVDHAGLLQRQSRRQHGLALWRADLDIPRGWRQVFGPGSKTECLAYVDAHWTDMRPLSLRRFMEEHPSR